jgi:hypothetical protein
LKLNVNSDSICKYVQLITKFCTCILSEWVLLIFPAIKQTCIVSDYYLECMIKQLRDNESDNEGDYLQWTIDLNLNEVTLGWSSF